MRVDLRQRHWAAVGERSVIHDHEDPVLFGGYGHLMVKNHRIKKRFFHLFTFELLRSDPDYEGKPVAGSCRGSYFLWKSCEVNTKAPEGSLEFVAHSLDRKPSAFRLGRKVPWVRVVANETIPTPAAPSDSVNIGVLPEHLSHITLPTVPVSALYNLIDSFLGKMCFGSPN